MASDGLNPLVLRGNGGAPGGGPLPGLFTPVGPTAPNTHDERLSPGLGGSDESVSKGKERLAGHHRARERKFRLPGLPHGDARAVHPRHLPGADAKRLFAATIDDGVRLHVLADLPAEHHPGPFLGRRLALGHDLELRHVAEGLVPVLHQHATDHGAHLAQ
jgi:hypothetical protein